MSDDSQEKIHERDLLAALERVMRDDHPNPDRIDCPEPIVIERLATLPVNEIQVDQATLHHISQCWPCFSRLKELKQRAKI